MNEVSPNRPEGSPPRAWPLTLTINPSDTPAADLPLGMVSDVAAVLQAWGLDVPRAAKADPAIWSLLLLAIGRVVDVVPTEFGGRAGGDES